MKRNFFAIFLRVKSFSPLIFNIFYCDLFRFLDGVTEASYTDDAITYSVNKKELVIKDTEHFSGFLFQWLEFNYIKINNGKSHTLLRK